MPLKTMPKMWPMGKPWHDVPFVFPLPPANGLTWDNLPPVKLPHMFVGDRLVVSNAGVMLRLRQIANRRAREVYEYWTDPDMTIHTSYLLRIA